jgi:hypothetical protein
MPHHLEVFTVGYRGGRWGRKRGTATGGHLGQERGGVGLEALSPGQKGPVAATWFTGKLKVTQGKILKPAVPPPIYEKDLMITVEKGRVVSQEVIDTFGGTHPPGQ